MEPDSREEKNAMAFLNHLVGLGQHTLRPPSYTTLNYLQLLGVTLAQGKSAYLALTPEEQVDELHAYLYVQAAPLPEVARAVRGFRVALRTTDRAAAFEAFMCDHVEPFLATLAPDVQTELAEQLEELPEIEAARVEAEPPAGSPRKPDVPNF